MEDSKTKSCLKISLNQGESVKELILNNREVIKCLYPLKYNSSYAPSILFPFANRINDGKYELRCKTYQLDIIKRN